MIVNKKIIILSNKVLILLIEGERQVIEIHEEQHPRKGDQIIECSGRPPIPMECQKKPNVGTCDVCGSPAIKTKTCKVTDGGCAKRKKQPKEKPCRGPIKRPLPACEEPDCRGFSKIDEENPALSFKDDTTSQMRVNEIFQEYDEEERSAAYKKANFDFDRNQNVHEEIDNTAQILNVNIPREDHCPPMKLKPQFWSKFAKTTTLPIKN